MQVDDVVRLPVAIDSSQARNVGLGWQGRWTLPLAVGVPIVAALAVAWSGRGQRLARLRLPVILATVFVIAQFLGFAAHLRRNTVGAKPLIDFWLHPVWSPPVPTWLLLGCCLGVLIALAVWIWRGDDDVSRLEVSSLEC